MAGTEKRKEQQPLMYSQFQLLPMVYPPPIDPPQRVVWLVDADREMSDAKPAARGQSAVVFGRVYSEIGVSASSLVGVEGVSGAAARLPLFISISLFLIDWVTRRIGRHQGREAPIQRLADSIAEPFVSTVLTLTAATFAFGFYFVTHIFPDVLMNEVGGPDGDPLILSLKLAVDQTRYEVDVRLTALGMGALVAGTKYQGEFEERRKAMLKAVEEADGKVILFLDEIDLDLGADRTESSMSAAYLFKPMLVRDQFRCNGATRWKNTEDMEKDAAFERQQHVYVDEPRRGHCQRGCCLRDLQRQFWAELVIKGRWAPDFAKYPWATWTGQTTKEQCIGNFAFLTASTAIRLFNLHHLGKESTTEGISHGSKEVGSIWVKEEGPKQLHFGLRFELDGFDIFEDLMGWIGHHSIGLLTKWIANLHYTVGLKSDHLTGWTGNYFAWTLEKINRSTTLRTRSIFKGGVMLRIF